MVCFKKVNFETIYLGVCVNSKQVFIKKKYNIAVLGGLHLERTTQGGRGASLRVQKKKHQVLA